MEASKELAIKTSDSIGAAVEDKKSLSELEKEEDLSQVESMQASIGKELLMSMRLPSKTNALNFLKVDTL